MDEGSWRHPPAAAVQGNHWRALPVEGLDGDGAGERPRVSVVVPVRSVPGTLPWLLASLEEQRYPAERLEVLVVGWDGTTLPEGLAAPGGTPVVALSDPERAVPCIGAARNRGIAHATGEVIVLLGAHTVAHSDLVAAHARWHAIARDLLVVGAVHRIASDALGHADAPEADLRALADDADAEPIPWWEGLLEDTDDLTTPSADRLRAVLGANLSVRRDHLHALGGLAELALPTGTPETAADGAHGGEGEAEDVHDPTGSASAVCVDLELGWRAIDAGTVVVPERAARVWTPRSGLHVGPPQPPSAAARVWLAERVPSPTLRPARVGRALPVPRAVVDLDATGADLEAVIATVDAALTGETGDVAVRVRTDEGPAGRPLREALRDQPRVLLDDAALPPAPLTIALDAPIPMRHDSVQGLFEDLVVAERAGVLRLAAPITEAEDAPERTVLAWTQRAVRAGARLAADRATTSDRDVAWSEVLRLAEERFGGGWESGSARGLGHGQDTRPAPVTEGQLDALQRAQQREARLEERLRKRERRIRRLERELQEARAQAEQAEEGLARLEGRRVVRALRRVDRLRRGDA